MIKQEYIEEMISAMAVSNNPFVDVPIEIMPKVAEALYNAGYRKIDDHAIMVLRKAKGIENRIRKKTAERDFNTIVKALEERKGSVKAFYGVAESVGVDIAIRTVKELAKQFGVEIKE